MSSSSVVTSGNVGSTGVEPEPSSAADMAVRITHVLKHFPRLSHSMLQVGLGPNLPPRVWRPVLDEMITEGEVKVETLSVTAPSGRQQSLTIISLAD